MSKDYLDKWEERQKQNTEIIEQQQTKTKKMNKYTVYDMWSAFVIVLIVVSVFIDVYILYLLLINQTK